MTRKFYSQWRQWSPLPVSAAAQVGISARARGRPRRQLLSRSRHRRPYTSNDSSEPSRKGPVGLSSHLLKVRNNATGRVMLGQPFLARGRRLPRRRMIYTFFVRGGSGRTSR